MRTTSGVWFLAVALLAAAPPAFAQAEFPYERELILDVKPLPGSKRVPMLEILPDGRAMIDLWCRSGEGRVEVTGDAIKITVGPLREEACTPERARLDDDLASGLEAATTWQVDDDVLVLAGPTELRYRLSTH
jgi:META domain